MAYRKNKQGGIDPTERYLLQRAKEADLVTLPKSIEGTNCGNCKFIRKQEEDGFCTHPKVQMVVNNRMCCALWDNNHLLRSFGKKSFKFA